MHAAAQPVSSLAECDQENKYFWNIFVKGDVVMQVLFRPGPRALHPDLHGGALRRGLRPECVRLSLPYRPSPETLENFEI